MLLCVLLVVHGTVTSDTSDQLNLTFAGRDTTAQALSWEFFWLIKNWQTAALDIRHESDGAQVTYDNYKSQVHALSAFNETLRLRPSVPSSPTALSISKATVR